MTAPSRPLATDATGRVIPWPVFTNPDQERALWREGFVVVDLLDEAAMAELHARFAAMTPDDNFLPTPGNTSQYHCTFIDTNLAYRQDVDDLTREVVGPRLADLLPEYEVLTSNIYVKQQHTGRFEVHLNWITVLDPMETTLTIWIPFRDATASTGTIHVVPGSHRLYPDVATAAAPQYFKKFHDELIEHHLVPIELTAGQAVVFDDTLIHWSPDNREPEPRVALQIEAVAKNAATAVWIPDPEDERWFILYEMDSRFWLAQDKSVFHGRPDLPVLARIPDANREVTYEEFCERLARSQEVRARSFVLPSEPTADQPPTG